MLGTARCSNADSVNLQNGRGVPGGRHLRQVMTMGFGYRLCIGCAGVSPEIAKDACSFVLSVLQPGGAPRLAGLQLCPMFLIGFGFSASTR